MDSNQTLDFPEFLSIMAMRMKDRDSDTDLREAFSLLDEEGTGYVKAAELFEMLVNIMGEKEDEVQGMLSEANVGKDGLINYEDFIRIILKWSCYNTILICITIYLHYLHGNIKHHR